MSRSRGPARRRGMPATIALAGWLFADLLLVLVLVSMGDRPDPLAARRPTASPSASAAPRPSPSPSPTGPRAVDKTPEKFRVEGEDKARLVDQIRKESGGYGDREAALVLTFGGGTSGTQYAHRVNAVLGQARSEMFTKNTATEDFLKLGERQSTAWLWVYFYTSPR